MGCFEIYYSKEYKYMHENMGSSKPNVDIEKLAENCLVSQHVMSKVLENGLHKKGEPTDDLDVRTFSMTLENKQANNSDISITSENGNIEVLEESCTSDIYFDLIVKRDCNKTNVSQQELTEVELSNQNCLSPSKSDLSQVAARTNYEEINSGTSSFPCEPLCDSDIRNVTATSGGISQREGFNTSEGQYFAEVLEDSCTHRADLEVAEQRGCGESNVSQPELPEVGTSNLDCDSMSISLCEINGKCEEIANAGLQIHKNKLDLGTSNQVIGPFVSSSKLDSVRVARSTSYRGSVTAILNSPDTLDSSLELKGSDHDSMIISLHDKNCKSEVIAESELLTPKSKEEHINTVPVDANSESTACFNDVKNLKGDDLDPNSLRGNSEMLTLLDEKSNANSESTICLNAVTNMKGDDLDSNNLRGDSEMLTLSDEKSKLHETRHLAANEEKHTCLKLTDQGVMDMLHSNGELASSIEESSRSLKIPPEPMCAQENKVSSICVKPQDAGKSSRSLRALLSLEHTDSFEKCIRSTVSSEKCEPDSMDVLYRASSAAKWSGDEHQQSHDTTNLFSGKWSDHLDMEAFTSLTFSGPVILSEAGIPYSGPVARSGSISHRSDSSTSTRSFAFPILAGEWNSSPATMGQPTSHSYRQRKRYHFCACCKKSSTVCD